MSMRQRTHERIRDALRSEPLIGDALSSICTALDLDGGPDWRDLSDLLREVETELGDDSKAKQRLWR